MNDLNQENQRETAPVVKMLNMLLMNAVRMGVSDIHLEPFEKVARVRFRIDGVLYKQKSPPKAIYVNLISRLKIMARLDVAEKRLPQDGRIKLNFGRKQVDLRLSILPSSFGEKAVIRILDASSLCL